MKIALKTKMTKSRRNSRGPAVEKHWCRVQPKEKPTSIALFPYDQTSYSWLSRILAKHSIKCVDLPPRQISILLSPVKDNVELKTQVVYSLPCDCGQVYIRQNG